ncbi:hypothetical protein NONI108955_22545 [Nocardia ninae]|uniref:Cysteine dioxygenase n=1 Tax=Nocardia ninae NBRC 108245 TaxID=1210091 RepID=A0A511MDF9_9NOCA|nr:hypothetical protein [Nocardia ninae]GEM38511.1 hypothetical protein NN4_30300 [Nocardia ninae NBRC 108245]
MTRDSEVQNWVSSEVFIDWTDLRSAHAQCRSVLTRLAADRDLLTLLVDRIADDEDLFRDADHHPVMDRLTLWRDMERGIYLRLHVSPGNNELIPHDHKYSFTTYILRGSYTHVWRRRTAPYRGKFSSEHVPLGLVTCERVGSCYTLGYSLVHQTMMEADTVTLFMRGPGEQGSSYAAQDMLDRVDGGNRADGDQSAPATTAARKHTDGQRPLELNEYRRLRHRLMTLGALGPVSKSRPAPPGAGSGLTSTQGRGPAPRPDQRAR